MTVMPFAEKAETYLRTLCVDIPGRCVGSAGNRAATDFFADTISAFGLVTDSPTFDCMDWTQDGTDLVVNSTSFEALVGPYSLGGQVNAPLAVISTVEELAAAEIAGHALLLRGDIAKEQLMPKNFTFYNPETHQHIYHLLETKQPAAIISATSQNPELVGGVYPFPLIEDGDFDIPSVYMKDVDGERLAEYAGQQVALDIRAARNSATGCNVIARKGADSGQRIVIFAHIDAKEGTPGAIDNGTGVVTLLLLAELLADYAGNLSIEIVAMNGEDYYAAPGEMQWLSHNTGKFDEIALGINLDGVGYHEGQTAYSLYDCPAEIGALIRGTFSAHEDMLEGDLWYQSDHGLFIQNQVPALAFTSSQFDALWTRIAHTPEDRPEIVDFVKLVDTATALHELLLGLDRLLA